MAIYLHGLSLSGYRGIGATPQKMAPMKDFNFFIGANNSGKSTVINFIARHLRSEICRIGGGQKQPFKPLDVHLGRIGGRITAAIAVQVEDFKAHALSRHQNRSLGQYPNDLFDKLLNVLASNGFIWLSLDTATNSYKFSDDLSLAAVGNALTAQEWNGLWNVLTGSSGGTRDQNWIPGTISYMLSQQEPGLPAAQLIPAIREIGPSAEQFSDCSGRGLIGRLAEIQSPDHDKRHEVQQFERINLFLQSVTGFDSARIEVPHNREHVLVHLDDKVLPLSSLGTGIQEIIMIAAFCTLHEDQIICIEEPELHLHPLLQRKLIKYLRAKTSNQYFIATHSAAFIDTEGAAIFHVYIKDNQTSIREAVLGHDRHSICMDLGARASDIVQSNAVIWVEGPSDRVYVIHWIQAYDSRLIEGIHYSVMFYGGRLLSHLSANDCAINDFIGLRSLNRNLALVMDSDRDRARSKINDTKMRLRREFEDTRGIGWITKGREIENYVDFGLLQNAVKDLYPGAYGAPANGGGPYDHALHFVRSKPSRGKANRLQTEVDKVGVARRVCVAEANLDVLDLRQQIGLVVDLIRKANHLS